MSLQKKVKRFFDFLLAIVAIFILTAPMIGIALIVKLTSKGPVIYWSDRVGRNNRIFRMPKFRTMRLKTPEIATEKLNDLDSYLILLCHISQQPVKGLLHVVFCNSSQ